METQHLIKPTPGRLSTYLALASFIIGTAIFLIYLSFPGEELILINGFLYVMGAIIVNSIALVYLLYHYAKNPAQREVLAIRILILLANIPIALLYLNIVFKNNLF